MVPRKIYKIQEKSINKLKPVLFCIFVLTVFFKTDFYDPFNSAKLIILIVFTSWILSRLITSIKENPIEFRSKEFLIFVLVLMLMISFTISTAFTKPFIVGLIGETQRRNGLISYLCLSIIFLYLSRVVNITNAILIYKVGIFTGIFVATYGIIQLNGKDFIKWNNPYNAMIGTLGNPNFASALLALLVLIGIYGFFLKTLPKLFKYLSIFLLGIGSFAIIGSQSRQGLIIIIFSLVFYISMYFFISNKKIGSIVIFLSVLASIFMILGMLQKGPLASIIYKESVSVRGYYWRAAIKMFESSPLLGVGMDRYGAYFKQFREMGYPLKYGYELSSTNAHNTFLQLFATSGIFVGSFYLIIILYIFLNGIKILKVLDPENKKLVLGLLSVWIGFQAQSLISIDNLGVSIWGWLFGGSIIGIANSTMKSTNADNIALKKNSNLVKNNVKLNLFQSFFAFLTMIFSLILIIPIYNSEKNLFTLVNIANPAFPQNNQLVLKYSNEIIQNRFADPFYKYRAIIFLYEMGFVKQAKADFENLYKTDPLNPDFLKGWLYFDSVSTYKNIEVTIRKRELISKVDPWNVPNYFELMLLYKENNDINNARYMKDIIIGIAPNSDIAAQAKEILG